MEDYGVETYFGDGRINMRTSDTLGSCLYINNGKYNTFKLPDYRTRYFICITPVLSKLRIGNAEWAFPNYSGAYFTDEKCVVTKIEVGFDDSVSELYTMVGIF